MKINCSAKMQKLMNKNERLKKGVVLLLLSAVVFGFALIFPKIFTAGGRELTKVQSSIISYMPRLPLASGLIGVYLILKSYLTQKSRIESMGSEFLSLADQELGQTESFVPGVDIYATEHFLIANVCEFELIPWERISNVSEIDSALTVSTYDGGLHPILPGWDKTDWGKDLQKEILDRMSQVTAEAKKKDTGRRIKLSSFDHFSSKDTTYEEFQFIRPSRGSAWAGGILMALCGVVIFMFLNGFRTSGPFISGITIYFLVSFGFCFGIPGIFHCGRFMDYWRPDAGRIPGFLLSLAVTAGAEIFYHVILLVTGYREQGYGFGYAAGHLTELLKAHGLWDLFQFRMIAATGIVLALGLGYEGYRLYRNWKAKRMEARS